MRRIAKAFIILICGILMACVWPLKIARREAFVDSMLGIEYNVTSKPVTQEEPYEQSFVAQTEKLNKVCFVLAFEGMLPEEGAVLFELADAAGQVLVEETIHFSEISNRSFCEVAVNRWLKRGQEYMLRLSLDESYDGLLYACYTEEEAQHALGSKTFLIGNERVQGQAVIRYAYEYPLNIKNIICIWGFLLAIAFAFWDLLKGDTRYNG